MSEKISRYSDLVIPNMDRKIFKYRTKIKSIPVDKSSEDFLEQLVTEDDM